MVPPFPRGGWNAHQPPFPEMAPTTQLTTLPRVAAARACAVVSQETLDGVAMSAIGVVITGGAADEKAHLGTVGGAADELGTAARSLQKCARGEGRATRPQQTS